MGFTALDIVVLVAVAGFALLGAVRGFVTEVLSLFAWVGMVFALKLFQAPLAQALAGPVGTVSGAAVLSFVQVAGVTYFAGRLIANRIGRRTRTSIIGPVDRALGLGFGALKGLIFASMAFLLFVLFFDFMGGGPTHRPLWMRNSRTYPLLNATSASMADMIDRRRHGRPVFGGGDDNSAEPVR